MNSRTTWRKALSRCLSLLAGVAIIVPWHAATGAPGDIFSSAAPAIGDAAPAATGISDGDSGVSTNTGAFTYSYPIEVPPGRNGMKPSISLSYSSQAPLYGGLAAGWSLSGLPIITEDTTGGRLWSTALSVPIHKYQSSMAGNRPLLLVTEPAPSGAITYRAQNDSTWVRYERYQSGPYWWRALTPEGMTYYFGHSDSHTSSCTIVSAGYAPVTRIEDALGNQVDFFYQAGVAGECRISAITWGQHAQASIGPFAAMTFLYDDPAPSCTGVNVGSQTSYRTGTKIVTGASQLKTIKVIAVAPSFAPPGANQPPVTPPEHTRTITLGYSTSTASCTAPHAPFRALTSIQESAVGVDSPQVDLPPVEFTYGNADVDYGTYQSAVLTDVPWSSSTIGIPPQPDVYNLGWGHRPDHGWPTVEAMMLDIDGDGLIDRVQSEPDIAANSGRAMHCRARWYRNRGPLYTGSGQFQPAGYIDIPTLKWSTPNTLPDYTGGSWAGSDPVLGGEERCALNYQRTAYHNSTLGFLSTCPPGNQACPTDANGIGVCSTTHSDCGVNKNASADTYFAWRWMDMDGDQLPDLVGSPVTGGVGSYDLQWGNRPSAPQEPPVFGTFPACPSTPYTGSDNWGADQYTMCHGMFPWFIYKNHGNGVFGQPRPLGNYPPPANWGPLPDRILYQPIPLESANGESSVTSRPVGQYEGMADIDGDGFADALHHGATSWKVFRNDGTGQLVSSLGTSPFLFGTGTPSFISRTDYTPAPNPVAVGVEGLEDFNGDGMVDHWNGAAGSSQAQVYWNDGVQFLSTGVSTLERPGPDGYPTVAAQEPAPSFYVCRGTRADSRRTQDLDSDGRADIVEFASGSTLATAQYNVGGQFTAPIGQLGPGAVHNIQVRTDNSLAPCDGVGWWETLSDLIDLDGDGIEEDVQFSSVQAFEAPDKMFVRRANNATAQRLMTSINNRHGTVTTISYSSMNGDAVTQTPSAKSSPATNWVAKSTTTTDSFASTTTTTSYKYRNPRWAPDNDPSTIDHSAFRGFEEVETTAQSGAVTIERYSYSPDWSGRLVAKIVKPSSSTSVHTIDETTWEARTLFGGLITTYHPTVIDHWACTLSQTESACRTNTNSRTRTTNVYAPRTSTSTGDPTALLWYLSTSTLQAGPTAATGDRVIVTSYALYSDASKYILRETDVQKNLFSAGTYNRTSFTWDPTFGTKLTEETWVDNDFNPASHLIERWVYDPITHNVIEHWKPKQNAAGTTRTVYTYDPRQLFVALETNELGHQTGFAYEYGTGTKLLTEGPNQRTCTGLSCPNGPSWPLKEQSKIRVDGLGRLIERYETVSPDGVVFTLYLAETNAYIDNGAISIPVVPNSTTNRLLIDETANTWRQQRTDIDGMGRPIKTTIYSQGTAPFDQVTTYAYRSDGTLQNVSVPDPSANDASLVTYTYQFDSLGRPISIRRPDSTTSGQSGVDIAYDGLTQTTTEVAGSAGGQIEETQTISDRFGRLSQVRERISSSTFATTNYTYGPDDLVTQIVDPAGVTTQLTHDFAGRRIQITRGTRDWKYGYDKNGNMVSEQVPGSTGPATDLDYTDLTAYDDLDRPQSKVIGKRTLTPTDQDLFVSNTETFTYDVGRIGPLHYWRAHGLSPGSELAVDTYHDGQGRTTMTSQSHAIAGYPALSRSLGQGFNITGTTRYVRPYDSIGGTNETLWNYSYDARNLPSKISMTSPQAMDIAVQTRNVAGLVKVRHTDTGPMTYVESSWTYDRLGRVTNQTVQQTGGTQVARQHLTYFGNDDVKSLDHFLGSSLRRFDYTYDRRHQITGVTSTPSTYFTASYTYSGAIGAAGRLTSVTHKRTISPMPPGADPGLVRDVSYLYSGSDPEQVTALKSGTATYASYTYDATGNQVTRQYKVSKEFFEYTYDGKDQLRRVVRKVSGSITGSEEYWYDANGQRFAVVKRDASGVKTELVWLLGDTEAHYDGTGAPTKTYSHISFGTPVARVERTGNTQATMEFQFHGLANNTLAAVAQDGTINASFSYAPFGEVLESTNAGGSATGTSVHMRRLNDKYEDELSSLAYYGSRYYDKTLFGWTQSDPLYRFMPDSAWSSPRRSRLYSYTLNNPLRYLDPDGLSPQTEVGRKAAEVLMSSAPEEVILAEGSKGLVRGVAPTVARSVAPTLAGELAAAVPYVAAAAAVLWIGDELTGGELSKCIPCILEKKHERAPRKATGDGTGADDGTGSGGEGSDTTETPDSSGSGSADPDKILPQPPPKPRNWRWEWPPKGGDYAQPLPRATLIRPNFFRRIWDRIKPGGKLKEEPASDPIYGSTTEGQEPEWMKQSVLR